MVRGTRFGEKRPTQTNAHEWRSTLLRASKSRRMWQTFIRCWAAFTVTLVFMVHAKVSALIGQSAFFCVIVALLLPPSLASSIFIVAVSTMMIGMLLGWAFGNAAMAAALSVRSPTLLASAQQQFQASLNPNIPVMIQAQAAVFHGLYLDPRSSAVYGAFFFIGTFLLGVIRAFIPNLTLLTIFATIVLDVICTTGPLIPSPQYKLAEAFVLPTCIYVAVALASLILVFPESLNHVWLCSLLDNFLAPTLDLLRLQHETLKARPSDYEQWTALYARAAQLRNTLIYDTDSLLTQIGLIDLDFSIGKLGPADLRKIHAELKTLLYRVGSIQAFQAFVYDRNKVEQKVERNTQVVTESQRFHSVFRNVSKREAEHGHNLDVLVPILAACSSRLRLACEGVVLNVTTWVRDCNKGRWYAIFRKEDNLQVAERHASLVRSLKSLQDALHEFRVVERVKLIKPYEKLFDQDTRKLKPEFLFTSRSLFTAFVFIDTLDVFSERLVNFMEVVIDLDGHRPKARFWFPGRISKVKENLGGSEFGGTAGLSMGTTDDPTTFNPSRSEISLESTVVDHSVDGKSVHETDQEVAPKKKRSNPDSFPPSTFFGKFWVRFAAFARFFKTPEGIFSLRLAVVSIALWIPSVCKASAWFYYVNKGLWALIMAQISLAVYAGDQIANFFLRIVGTFIGLLIGTAIWYIGAGLGTGNPYGIVIATSVFTAPFLFARVALPPEKIALFMMVGVTIVFVVGYSWTNAHWRGVGNPGIGIVLGWKRALLVIVGFTAAFIVMLFPNPVSSRVRVRKTLAATINEIGDIYATEVEAFLSEEALTRQVEGGGGEHDVHAKRKSKDVSFAKDERVKKTGQRVIAIVTKLKELTSSLTYAKYEPQLSGPWPAVEYKELFDILSRSLGALILVITSFGKLDSKWCTILVHKTPFLNPNFISDIFMTVSLLSNCLMHGTELPPHLPILRDRLVYHAYKRGPFLYNQSNVGENKTPQSDSVGGAEEEGDGAATPVSEKIVLEELTLDVLMDAHLPAHATAVIALSSLLSRIDEMTEIIKRLCGQATTFKGYDTLQQFYIDKEKAVGGGLYHVSHL